MTMKEIERLTELADKSQLLEEKWVQESLGFLSLDFDEEIYRWLEEFLSYKALPTLTKKPFYPYPEIQGRFQLGSSPESDIALTSSILNQNLLLVGRVGAGKTNLLSWLEIQLDRTGIPFWTFDYKRDHRHLLPLIRNLLVIRWEDLKLNILRPPPGVDPLRWKQVLAEVIGKGTGLLHRSKNYLDEEIDKLYRGFTGILEGERIPKALFRHHPAPTLKDLKQLIDLDWPEGNRNKQEARWIVQSRIDSLLRNSPGIFDCDKGYPWEELLDRSIVFELDGLGEDFRNILSEILWMWVYLYRFYRGERTGELKHMLITDEARHLFDIYKEKNVTLGRPIIDDLTVKSREFGEGLVVADQEPSKITDSLKANCFTKVMLPLGSGKDLDEMGLTLGLDNEQVDYSHQLEVGEAIIQVGEHDPVPLNVPYIPVKKSVTDKQIKEGIEDLPFSPPKETTQFKSYLSRFTSGGKKERKISKEAETFLESVAVDPFINLTTRYEKLELTNYKGKKVKDELLEKSFLKEVKIGHGPGGKPTYFEITERGQEFLENLGIQVTRKGRGGIKHRYYQRQVHQHFLNQGWESFIEYRDLDMYAEKQDKKVGVEIISRSDYPVRNLGKYVKELKLDRLIALCLPKKSKDDFGKKTEAFSENIRSVIQFKSVKEFFSG